MIECKTTYSNCRRYSIASQVASLQTCSLILKKVTNNRHVFNEIFYLIFLVKSTWNHPLRFSGCFSKQKEIYFKRPRIKRWSFGLVLEPVIFCMVANVKFNCWKGRVNMDWITCRSASTFFAFPTRFLFLICLVESTSIPRQVSFVKYWIW